MPGFNFGQYRGEGGIELKQRFAKSGETFDITWVDRQFANDGTPIFKLSVSYGDGEKGVLFFSENNDDPRTDALIALESAFVRDGIPAVPAVMKSRRTKAGYTYFWLDDPE